MDKLALTPGRVSIKLMTEAFDGTVIVLYLLA
jgi:hypothetical protein